jgi:maltooligosyltrehalose trehalohydrolase
MTNIKDQRRLPVGVELLNDGGAHFRVWAPRRKRVAVVIEGQGTGKERTIINLESEEGGYFSGIVPVAKDGTLYKFKLDNDDYLYPDPVSRFQPEGPHGPSQIVDPKRFHWTDEGWKGVELKGQVIYEMHIGTFTKEGTWHAAIKELPYLAETGITVLEVMPVADFPGNFGWGYDGVDMFAPTRLYGSPDDFRLFVNKAHELGMAVILDVVYNHLGPDGNYLKQFSEDYFTDRYENEWGEAINFDDDNAGPVREFFLSNVKYWIEEFHIDGLRLDATQQIFDASKEHILAAITRTAQESARGRSIITVAENEPQHTQLVRPLDKDGYGIDALWNDDFHHSARVALTGHNEAYYTDYLGTPQEFISAVKWGYLYQGQWYKWQKQRRGTPGLDLEPAKFVTYIQNHDQVANSVRGLRVSQLTSPGRLRAMTALLLLAPGTPMLFQGQEFGASTPFLYFADHCDELGGLVHKGRKKFLSQFPSIASKETQNFLDTVDSCDIKTFERSKLDYSEREKNVEIYNLHKDLLKLRREDPVFKAQKYRGLDGAILSEEAFVLRFFGWEKEADRLLVINLGRDLHLNPAPEPLLAPPFNMNWTTLWSSEDLRYGGDGTYPLDSEENWRIPGHAAVVLIPEKIKKEKTENERSLSPDKLERS